MRIAMWSGPRNLSTALMYAFAARDDCAVWDEPYYAAYLQATGLKHPMHREVLAGAETDPAHIASKLSGPAPKAKALFYQKHMTHHMIPAFDRAWFADVTHVFLIRDPARVIASYSAKREHPTQDDIGFRQQAEIFGEICDLNGTPPPVIDSAAIRQDPEGTLRRLCKKLGINFQKAMLGWPQGGHQSDGIWATHWYGAVHKSTGFAAVEGLVPDVGDDYRALEREARTYYDGMTKYLI